MIYHFRKSCELKEGVGDLESEFGTTDYGVEFLWYELCAGDDNGGGVCVIMLNDKNRCPFMTQCD